MREGARLQAAIVLLEKILLSKSSADTIITPYFRQSRYMGSGDRQAISGMVYQILRRYEELKWYAQGVPPDKPGWGRLLVLACIHKLQGMSVPQISALCQKPLSAKSKAGFKRQTSGSLPKETESGKFDPEALSPLEIMVLERMVSLKLETAPLWVRLNIPEWVLSRLERIFGTSLQAEMTALNQPAAFDLRVNTLKTTREEVLLILKDGGFDPALTPWSPVGIRLKDRRPLSGHPLWQRGEIEVQDEGSQLAGLLADARPAMTVLDFCAGAGGKSLTMAASMENRGRIVATDTAGWRLARSRERVRRAGINNVEFRALEEEATVQWLKRQKERFDRVLLDVPCSGSGTWRRNPDLKRQFVEQTLTELCLKQQEILKRTAPLVKKGGRLVYVTCSLFPEENSEQVQTLLQAHADFSLLPIGNIWSMVLKTDCPSVGDTLQLTPHQHQVDGFFIAVMERQG